MKRKGKGKAPVPKRTRMEDEVESDSDAMSSSSSSEGGSDSDGSDDDNDEIEANFEVNSLYDDHFHAVKALVTQTFKTGDVDVSSLIDVLLEEANVGSVVQVADSDDVFGVMSAIDMHYRKEAEVVGDIRAHLLNKIGKGDSESASKAARLLDAAQTKLVLMVSERFINVPFQMAGPLFKFTYDEMVALQASGTKYTCDYYVFVVRYFKHTGKFEEDAEVVRGENGRAVAVDSKGNKKKKKSKVGLVSQDLELMGKGDTSYARQEDELVVEAAAHQFSYELVPPKDQTQMTMLLTNEKLRVFNNICFVAADRMPDLVAAVTRLHPALASV